MKIYTSYFAKVKKLPKDIIVISVARYNPPKCNMVQYKNLFPTCQILRKYKDANYYYNEKDYIKDYQLEVLNKLNIREVYNQFYKFGKGKDICLVCYEKSDSFCHRHIIAKWFKNNGIECEEYIYEENK